jgi:chromate transport protein ChrA
MGASLMTYFLNAPTFGLLIIIACGLIFLFIVIAINKKTNKTLPIAAVRGQSDLSENLN